MGRWPGGTRQRLQRAALALFVERGYAGTTVDEIVARAGVSQRTFFRHFRDKEEVLFDRDEHLLEVIVSALRGAPESAPPVDLAAAALRALAGELGPEREFLRTRDAVLASDVALRGRDLAKQSRWGQVVAGELIALGTAPEVAALLAGAAGAAFQVGYAGWLAAENDSGDPAADLERRVVGALHTLADALR